MALPAAVIARFLARHVVKRIPWWGVPTLILAEPERGAEIHRRLKDVAEQGFRPAGVLLDPDQYWSGKDRLQSDQIPVYEIRMADEVALKNRVTFVIVSNCANRPTTPALDASLAVIPNRIMLSSEDVDMGIWDHIYTVGSTSGLRLAGVQPNSTKLALKRMLQRVRNYIR